MVLERNIRYGSSSFKIFKEIYGPFKGAIICMVKSLYEFLKFLFYLFIILSDIRINFFIIFTPKIFAIKIEYRFP
jgi:hypothetical protein